MSLFVKGELVQVIGFADPQMSRPTCLGVIQAGPTEEHPRHAPFGTYYRVEVLGYRRAYNVDGCFSVHVNDLRKLPKLELDVVQKEEAKA